MNRRPALLKFVIAQLLLLPMFPAAGAAQAAGTPARHTVLIAAEQTDFKSGLVKALETRLQKQNLVVQIIDLNDLAVDRAAKARAIVIIHTWESSMPPPVVIEFLTQLGDVRRVIDVTTSATGAEKLAGVDAISSASVMDEIPELVRNIGAKIDALVANP